MSATAQSMKKRFFLMSNTSRYTKRVAFISLILMVAFFQYRYLSNSVTLLNHSSAISNDNISCFDSPMTLAIGIGGKDCSSRLTNIGKLRMLLYSLEQEENDDETIYYDRGPATTTRRRRRKTNTVHIQLWLNSDDNTTLPFVNQITSDLDYVASVTSIDIGNSTELTNDNSPPICECFIHRPYDWVKFWGIHHENNPRRYILNIDVDAVFASPLVVSLSEVWRDGCEKLLANPESFYVATRETMNSELNNIFGRYINSGIVFLDLNRRNEAYNRSVLTNYIIPHVHKNESLQAEGMWPPEQWLWNSIFEHYPQYLALFNESTCCNCATHELYPGADECQLAHYCNTAEPLLFKTDGGKESDLLPFSSSLAEYIKTSRPMFYSKVVSAEKLHCPVSS